MPRPYNYKKTLLTIGLLLICSAPASAAPVQAAPPVVDRAAAETAFLEAYDFFIQNRLWNCMEHLDASLRENVYFVDAYYMKSLALRRLGRYPEAIAAIESYLEVRKTDPRALLIADAMRREWKIIGETIRPSAIDSNYFFVTQTRSAFIDLPLTASSSFSGMNGLGKIASTGGLLLACDMYGDKVWGIRRTQKPLVMTLDTPRPAVAAPLTPTSALLFAKSGDIGELRLDFNTESISYEPLGHIAANVADAVFVDSTLFAVADRTGQAVRLYGLPSLGETAEWRPAGEGEKMFEPVALAADGPLLAIADRGNGRLYIVDAYTLSERHQIDVPTPRDVDWGQQGELYILSENGTLYAYFLSADKEEKPVPLAQGLTDAWSLAWTTKGPVICDLAGRTWWSSGIVPGQHEALGAMTMHEPWIEENASARTLMVRCAASSVYHQFIQGKIPDTQAIWRNEVRPSRVVEINSSNRGRTSYYSPSSGEAASSGVVTQANTLADVMRHIAESSRGGAEMPKVIVLDTRIFATEDELSLFLAFLLQQGIRLDLWAIARPASSTMHHLSKITLGYCYYSRVLETVQFNDSFEWILSIPLPPDLHTFGYPSEATLSVFATVDVIRFADWMPIWPSLLKRK